LRKLAESGGKIGTFEKLLARFQSNREACMPTFHVAVRRHEIRLMAVRAVVRFVYEGAPEEVDTVSGESARTQVRGNSQWALPVPHLSRREVIGGSAARLKS
jgi:hypothetical protein